MGVTYPDKGGMHFVYRAEGVVSQQRSALAQVSCISHTEFKMVRRCDDLP